MKNLKLGVLIAGLAACALALALQGFTPPPKGLPSFYSVAFPAKTITNASNDTVYLPKQYNVTPSAANMADVQGRWSYAYYVIRANTSGTTNVSVWLQETGVLVPVAADWMTVDSTVLATAIPARLSGSLILGRHQRLIYEGRGSAQVSTVTATAVLKAE